jgi:signal transduction histidine kinase
MIVGIGGILVVVILVYGVLALRRQAFHLRAMTEREAGLLITVAERSVASAMAEGKGSEIQDILEQIGKTPEVEAIRIVGTQWVILRSGKPEETGKVLDAGERPINDGRGLKVVWDARGQKMGIFRAILNSPECFACHSQSQTVLGYLNVQLATAGLESGMVQEGTRMIGLAVFALIAAGGMITVYFAFVVSRRIDALSQAMSQVEAGDLTVTADDDQRDELGRLGKSFNTMVARLADARRQLEDRHTEEIRRAENLASLGKMAAGIAHEINNPLAGMQNCVRTLLKGTLHAKKQSQYLAMLKDGLDRISRIVGQLLNFARAPKPKFIWTDIESVLGRCLSLLEHELMDRKIALNFTADSSVPKLLADPYQLEQLFLNILINAVDAMPDGGNLKVSTGLNEWEARRFVAVRMTDSGVGISSEHLPQIFDPFFTTKEVGEGTGLGLSVSYGIVKAHGGSIDVESQTGNGTTVTVLLPIIQEGENSATPGPLG